MFEEEDVNTKIKGIYNQCEKLQFAFKIKFDKQEENLNANKEKIQELEQKINQLQIENDKKQQEIDTLIVGQQKLTNDLKKLWNHLNAKFKTQSFNSQMASNITINTEQFPPFQQPQQTKSIIQQEIQNRFLLIKDTFMKKSEFDDFQKKVEEQFETYRQKLLSQPDFQQNPRKDSFQQSTISQFQFQTPSQKGDIQTMKQQLEKREQIMILNTEIQDK